MHASIEQLLELRDAADGASGQLRGHVEGCARCAGELQRLRSLRDDLRALEQVSPPADAWEKILERAASQPAAVPGQGSRWPLALAASVALALLVAWLLPRTPGEMPVSVDRAVTTPAASATADLVAESQRLERLLHQFDYEPRVVNAGTAGTIVALEDQIAWVDYGLTAGREAGLSASEARALWQQRVELMNSLVHVRYAQAQRIDF